MRIISGELKGRSFNTPKGHKTHPMGDRIKVALFNTIAERLPGARVLDAYAGSGALGFEAYSRGAEFVQLIEKDHAAFRTIQENIGALPLDPERLKATRANCASWAENNGKERFDVILLDPPYDQLNFSTIFMLSDLLTPEGLMVLSHPGREMVPVPDGVVVVDDRMYGDAALSYYRKAD